MFEQDKWISIGEIVAPQGLRGDIRIKPCSDFSERFTKPGKRWIQKANELPTEIKLKKGTLIPGKSIYVLSIEGVSNRSSAEEIIGWKLVIPVDSRPKLGKDEYHYFDLIGLEARSGAHKSLIGYVTDLIKGGNDLLEIELVEGKKFWYLLLKKLSQK